VKPRERNTRYVDAVMTVPKGTLYPMCGMNLAFDRSAAAGGGEPAFFHAFVVTRGGVRQAADLPTDSSLRVWCRPRRGRLAFAE